MGARPADALQDVAFKIEHKQNVTRRIEHKQAASVAVNCNRRWIVKQTLVSAFADVADELPVGAVHQNESAFGVGDVNVVGRVHRNPTRQPQAALRASGNTEGTAVPEDVNGMDVRINHEDTSTGVNGHVMGRQKNSFPSVDKGDKVVPK